MHCDPATNTQEQVVVDGSLALWAHIYFTIGVGYDQYETIQFNIQFFSFCICLYCWYNLTNDMRMVALRENYKGLLVSADFMEKLANF